jgi:hypothetical protein
MKKFKGTLMNTFTDLNNIRLTDEVIEDILRNQPQVPVTFNFNGQAIGSAESYSLEDGSLVVQIRIDEGKVDLIDRLFVVPGMNNVEFHNEGDVRVIDRGDLNEVSITSLPANTRLQPIKKE